MHSTKWSCIFAVLNQTPKINFMKQLFFFLITLMFSTTTINATPAFSAPPTSFSAIFPNAKEVKWEKTGLYDKVTFSSDGKVHTAFFDGKALIAITRSILADELPKKLKASLKEELNNFWITDLIIMTTKDGDNYYYVQLENASSKIVKQASGNKWTMYSTSN